MAGTMDILIHEVTMTDCNQVYGLWTEIRGFGVRSTDDSWDGMERFLRRNPTTSMVAVQNGHIIENILCGHDGRTGCFYHVCVALGYRKHGIGYRMMRFAMEALQKEGVSRIGLIAFKENEVGNTFWQGTEWRGWEDVDTYGFMLNEENITWLVR